MVRKHWSLCRTVVDTPGNMLSRATAGTFGWTANAKSCQTTVQPIFLLTSSSISKLTFKRISNPVKHPRVIVAEILVEIMWQLLNVVQNGAQMSRSWSLGHSQKVSQQRKHIIDALLAPSLPETKAFTGRHWLCRAFWQHLSQVLALLQNVENVCKIRWSGNPCLVCKEMCQWCIMLIQND